MGTVQTRYHVGLLAQRERAWRQAVQTGAWQDWQAHSILNERVQESRTISARFNLSREIEGNKARDCAANIEEIRSC